MKDVIHSIDSKFIRLAKEGVMSKHVNQAVFIPGDLVDVLVLDHRLNVVIADDRKAHRKNIVGCSKRGIVTGHLSGSSQSMHDMRNSTFFVYVVMVDGLQVIVSPHEVTAVTLRHPEMDVRMAALTRIVDEKLSGIGRDRFEQILRRKMRKNLAESTAPDALDEALVHAMCVVQNMVDFDK